VNLCPLLVQLFPNEMKIGQKISTVFHVMSIVCVTLCVCMPLNLLHSHFASRGRQQAQAEASFVDFHNSGPYPLQTKEVTNLAAGHNLQFYTFTGYL